MARKRPAPEPELEVTERDYVMARLAAARVGTADALAAIDEALEMYTHPDEDRGGKKRKASIGVALEALGDASRAVESAEEVAPDVDPAEGEPWDDEEEPDDDEHEGDDDDDDPDPEDKD